jgi:hypothetical protein
VNRRGFLKFLGIGTGVVLAAPAIVRASSIMPISAPRIPAHILSGLYVSDLDEPYWYEAYDNLDGSGSWIGRPCQNVKWHDGGDLNTYYDDGVEYTWTPTPENLRTATPKRKFTPVEFERWRSEQVGSMVNAHRGERAEMSSAALDKAVDGAIETLPAVQLRRPRPQIVRAASLDDAIEAAMKAA